MSGGHFDYIQHNLGDAAEELRLEAIELRLLARYSDKTMERFDLAAKTALDASKMIQRIDYLISGDDGEESFNQRWNEEIDTK